MTPLVGAEHLLFRPPVNYFLLEVNGTSSVKWAGLTTGLHVPKGMVTGLNCVRVRVIFSFDKHWVR